MDLIKTPHLSEAGGAIFDCRNASPTAVAGTWRSDLPSEKPPGVWFAVYTSPRHEKSVSRQLETRDVNSFLPLYRSSHRWKNGCKVEVEQPLFPNYIFVRSERRHLVRVRQVPGVLSIVGCGREPSELPEYEIESLRVGLPWRTFEPCPYLAVGEKVRIVSGPLSDMVGVLIRKKNSFRVVLTLDLILRSVAVEVGIDEVEPYKG